MVDGNERDKREGEAKGESNADAQWHNGSIAKASRSIALRCVSFCSSYHRRVYRGKSNFPSGTEHAQLRFVENGNASFDGNAVLRTRIGALSGAGYETAASSELGLGTGRRCPSLPNRRQQVVFLFLITLNAGIGC